MLTEFAQPPSFRVSSHSHDSATLLFTMRGFAADLIARRVEECKPLSLMIRPAGESHTHHYGVNGLHGLVIEVKPQRLPQIRSFSNILDRVGNFNDPKIADLGMRLYMESRIRDNASELAIEGLVLELLAQAIRQSSKSNTATARTLWLHQAREFIHEKYTESLSLSHVASSVGVHPAHLAKMFRIGYGCTVGQYIRRLRLDHAARELVSSDKSLTEISAAAGFYDQSHFTRLFKRQMGKSPSELRALALTPKAHTKSLRSSKSS